MPRLEIHSAVSRSSSTTAHSASNAPIINHTAEPSTTAPANGRMRKQVERRSAALTGAVSSATVVRATHGTTSNVAPAMTRNGAGMPNGPTSSADTAGPGGEPADVGGDQPAEVVPEAFRLGEDHDAADRRHRHPDADAHDEPAGEQRHEAGGERHQHEAGDVERHPAEHELPGVAPVGQRGDQQLGQEAGEEPDPDDRAERRLADPVLVPDSRRAW